MNLLGHLVLGYPDPESMQGQFLGDFIRGPVKHHRYPQQILEGIRAHRRVDASGDRHPMTRFAKSLLPPDQRRVAGIVLDVMSDAFLLRSWDRILETDPRQTVAELYQFLGAHHPDWPESAQRTAAALVRYSLLDAAADPGRLPELLARIQSRLRRPAPLQEIRQVFENNEEMFLERFPGFFRDMQDICSPASRG